MDAAFPLHRYKLQHQVSVSVSLIRRDLFYVSIQPLFSSAQLLNKVSWLAISRFGRAIKKSCFMFFSSSNGLLRGGSV